jgi:hypothetical protein
MAFLTIEVFGRAWESPEIGFPPCIPCTTPFCRFRSPLPRSAVVDPGNPRTSPQNLSPAAIVEALLA